MVAGQLILPDNEMLSVKRFINSPVNSNTYLIKDSQNNECVVIDPGSPDISEIKEFILRNDLILRFIILTHEHFDHIWGLEELRLLNACKVVSSEICAQNICDKKKNLSVFFDQKGFTCKMSDITTGEEYTKIKWNLHLIELISTPGHTESSICIAINDLLFTGDTILNNSKVVTKLPGGDKNNLIISIEKIYKRFKKDTIVYPGHEDHCLLNEINVNNLI